MLTVFLPCTFSILFTPGRAIFPKKRRTSSVEQWAADDHHLFSCLHPRFHVPQYQHDGRNAPRQVTNTAVAWFCFGYLTDSSHFVHFFDFFVLGCFTLVVLLWLFYFAVLCCAWLSIDMGHFTLAHSLQHHAKHRRRGPGSCHTVHECQ